MTGKFCTINTALKTCSCSRFLDFAICKHLTAACLKLNLPLNGLKLRSDTFRTLRRRIKNNEQDINESGNDDIVAISDKSDDIGELTQARTQLQVECLQPSPKPRRGRPTKAESALRKEKEMLEKAIHPNSKRNSARLAKK